MSIRENLRQRLAADVAALGLPRGPAQPAMVPEARLAGLPPPAQRYLRFMGVAGRPADWSFLAHTTGRFRLRPGLPWLRCEAWQYSTCPAVIRLFHLRLSAAGVLRMTGRDAYAAGQGRMHGTLAGLVTVADSAGPETSVSELVTYLNDAVLLAPSMLLALPVMWAPVDDDSFEVTLEDSGHRVTARARRAGRLQHRGPLVRAAGRRTGPRPGWQDAPRHQAARRDRGDDHRDKCPDIEEE
jgi:hypothetical protein